MLVPGGAAVPGTRRHDLDALRALAMLLGIGLHGALSFTPGGWVVRDSQQSGLLGLGVGMIHGFRMPLFFLISGFFTALVWRRRGLRALLTQRAQRILLPCLLGLVTIIPAMDAISAWAGRPGPARPLVDDGSLSAAIRLGDRSRIHERSTERSVLEAPDPTFGVTPLHWAALLDDRETLDHLLEQGADPDVANRDRNRPLHAAAFLGRDAVVERLLAAGADPNARNGEGEIPLSSTRADLETTRFISSLLRIPLPEESALTQGRDRVRARLEPLSRPATADRAADWSLAGLRTAYNRLVHGPGLRLNRSWHLVDTDLFHHLWFLWFLCWLVPLFALVVAVLEHGPVGTILRRWFGPPRGLWLLVGLSLIPQLLMGSPLGPDTAAGLLPPPHLLLYYGLFFGFGVLLHDAGEVERQVGRNWRWLLPLMLVVVFPLALVTIGNPPLNAVAQVVYAWGMSLGLIGLFRATVGNARPWVRSLSDSAYWLYLAHLPLIIAAQRIVRDWPLPAVLKLLLICFVVTALLLVIDHLWVRRSWLDALLNGRREPARQAS